MITQFLVKNGRYMDSVALMKVARDIREAVAVDDVALMMATDANKKLMEQVAPLSAEAYAAKASDLIVMITGEETACKSALAYQLRTCVGQTGLEHTARSKMKNIRQLDGCFVLRLGNLDSNIFK